MPYKTKAECLERTGWPYSYGLCSQKDWKKLIKKAKKDEQNSSNGK